MRIFKRKTNPFPEESANSRRSLLPSPNHNFLRKRMGAGDRGRHKLQELASRNRTYIPKEPVCLVTFNSDTLLEEALRQFGLPIASIEDYTRRHPFYRIFKLHGSIDWAREVETNADIELGPNTETILAQLIEQITDNPWN